MLKHTFGLGQLGRRAGNPVLLTMLGDGRLHLSGIAVLVRHLTDANCDEILARATRKTKREILELVAEIAPKPDVPPSIRKVPERRKEKNKETETANELRPDAVSEDRASTAENTLDVRKNRCD